MATHMNRLHWAATLVCTILFFSLVLIPFSMCATSSTSTVTATTASGATVSLGISGNITSTQMTNIEIATNQSAETVTLSFSVIGKVETTGFSNITIPKSGVSYGTNPTVYIDGLRASSQGFTQDAKNFYVWYATGFSNHGQSIGFATHEVSVVFIQTSLSPSPTVPEFSPQLVEIALVLSLVVVLFGAIIAKKRKT